jgi:hypothetical protein
LEPIDKGTQSNLKGDLNKNAPPRLAAVTEGPSGRIISWGGGYTGPQRRPKLLDLLALFGRCQNQKNRTQGQANKSAHLNPSLGISHLRREYKTILQCHPGDVDRLGAPFSRSTKVKDHGKTQGRVNHASI